MATQNEVNAACVAVAARGERPTVQRVTDELGGGSPNQITPLVRAWKEAHGGNNERAAAPAAVVEPGALPASLQRALDAVVAAADGLAPAFGAAVADVAESERRRSRLEVEAAAAGAQAQVQEAQAAAEDERGNTDLVRNEVEEKTAELARLAAMNDGLAVAVRKLEGELEAERSARRETDERAAGEQAAAAAERERLTVELADVRTAATDAASRAASAESARDAAAADAARAREESSAAVAVAEGERRQAAAAVATAEATAAAAEKHAARMEEAANEQRKASLATELRLAEERGRLMQLSDTAAEQRAERAEARAAEAEARLAELSAGAPIKQAKKLGRPAKPRTAAIVEQSPAAAA